MNKRLSALILCVVLVLSLFAGCTTETLEAGESLADTAAPTDELETPVEETPETEPETTQEAEIGPVRAGIGIAWQSTAGLHPYTSTSVTNQTILSLIYESLFVVDDSFDVRPQLCSRCAVSEDGTVWYLEIDANASFSDGSGMLASDVVTSLNAARSSSMYQTRFLRVTSVEQSGTHGVIIRLTGPYENLPMILDVPIVKGSTVSSSQPIGSGPYAMGDRKLIRNQNWWQEGSHVVEAAEIELVAADDPLSVRNAFEFGGADLAYVDPSASTLSAYHSDNERWGTPTTVMLYAGFNQNSNYCYSASLRGGVTYAVDRETIIQDIYGGFGLAASLPCSPLSSLYDGALAESYSYNPGSFQACLISSGISPNPASPLRIIVSDTSSRRIQAAKLIAEEMENLGVYTEVVVHTEENFLWALASGSYDMYVADIRLPTNFDLTCFFTYGASACYGGNNSDSAMQLVRASLENSGNYYDLFRTVMSRGLICPILFKVNALYATRGLLDSCEPAVSNLLYGGNDLLWSDILDEEFYVAPEPGVTDPEDGMDIVLPGEEPDEPDEPSDPNDLENPDSPEDGNASPENPDEEAPIITE